MKKNKNKKQNRIQYYAEQIILFEKEIDKGNNIKENEKKIEDIMSKLSFQEMEQLDDYIMQNNY